MYVNVNTFSQNPPSSQLLDFLLILLNSLQETNFTWIRNHKIKPGHINMSLQLLLSTFPKH